MATINGKSVKECCALLAKYKNPTKMLQGKYPYYPISLYRARLDEVLGMDHYNVTYSQVQFFRINSGQEMLSVTCRITVLDDDYKPIFYKEGCGTKELQYTNATQRLDGINNILHSASTGAFKNACKNFSMFGDKTNEDMMEDEVKPLQNQGKDLSPKDTEKRKDVIKIRFVICKKPEIVREDDRAGKPVYRAVAHIAEGNGKMREEECEIIFYPNQYRSHVDFINELCFIDNPRLCTLCVSESSMRNGRKQYIFKGV